VLECFFVDEPLPLCSPGSFAPSWLRP
jgi:hypothetical protein